MPRSCPQRHSARYFRSTLPERIRVSISISAGTLYLFRARLLGEGNKFRSNNGKLLHGGGCVLYPL